MSVDPGGVATETVLTGMSGTPVIGSLLRFAISKLARSPLDGAATALFAATSPDVARRRAEFQGALVADFGAITRASKDAENPELAGDLWKATENITEKILSESN